MSAREDILARLARAAPAAPAAVAPAGAPAARGAGPAPAGGGSERLRRFAARLRSAAATCAAVDGPDAVPDAVADYLAAAALPPRIHLGETPAAAALRRSARLECAAGAVDRDGSSLVTGCLAGIAEEGAVVLASGPGHAPETAFLAATHIVVLEAGQLLDRLDDLWPLLRARRPPPRMVNVVLGPSRTADLGVPSRLGAHGPLRVHVIVVAPGLAPYVE